MDQEFNLNNLTEPAPLVGVLMGSDSDLPIMRQAATILEQFVIPYELKILSAHRTPHHVIEYASAVQERGLQVIIAGAGGAAHLAGIIAALTPLPVIGVPIKTPSLSGQDSLFSIVQMPPGIPVATVAIDGAQNAGILAAQILGVADSTIRARVIRYKIELEQMVLAKVARLAH